MGLNGQAQYWAHNIDEACHILMRHYDHTYVAPGERFPGRAATSDPLDRDVRLHPHGRNGDGDEGFDSIGDILSDETNPGRKKSFDIRKVMVMTAGTLTLVPSGSTTTSDVMIARLALPLSSATVVQVAVRRLLKVPDREIRKLVIQDGSSCPCSPEFQPR